MTMKTISKSSGLTTSVGSFEGFLTTGDPEAAEVLIKGALRRAGVNHAEASKVARRRAGSLAEAMKPWRELQTRRLLARSIREDWSEDELTERLALVVGLTRRQEETVERFRVALVDGGEARGVARQRARELARRHKKNRARVLGRTEVQHALNEALRQEWRADVSLAKTKRIWVLGKNENHCVICKGLAGRSAGMFGLFKGTGQAHPGPPAHPNCMCYEILA